MEPFNAKLERSPSTLNPDQIHGLLGSESCPLLVLVSSRVRYGHNLIEFVHSNVVIPILFKYEISSLNIVLGMITQALNGRRAASIALICTGYPGKINLASERELSLESLENNNDIRSFLVGLVKDHLDTGNKQCRLDILGCEVAENMEGIRLLKYLEEMLGVEVYSSSSIHGPELSLSINKEQFCMPISLFYFDSDRLNSWAGLAQPSLDMFEKIKTVGKGTYGAAVLYRRKADNMFVVLKEVSLINLGDVERELVKNEVKVLSMLDHPNIITFYDSFYDQNIALYIEMEYADGGTLAQYILKREHPILEQDLLFMFMQICKAVKYMHLRQILHRDLKTANIFLTKEGTVKVGDFGIAKVLNSKSQLAETVLGTPYYISPEICQGQAYNSKTDIWSIGCILHEMSELEKPFDGTNFPALIKKIVQGKFQPITRDYSQGLKDLANDLLSTEPSKRPSSAEIVDERLPLLLDSLHERVKKEIEEENLVSFLYKFNATSLTTSCIPLPDRIKVTSVSVGYSHIGIISTDNKVYTWGRNEYGQLGNGNTNPCFRPEMVAKSNEIILIQCGKESTLFLSDKGLSLSCGSYAQYCLGSSSCRQDILLPNLIDVLVTEHIVQLSLGELHAAAITSNGEVFTWGYGKNGRLGNGSEKNCLTPTQIDIVGSDNMIEEVKLVRCGLDSTMFLTTSSVLYACGCNRFNKLGLNKKPTMLMTMRLFSKDQLKVEKMLVPTLIKNLTKHIVLDVALGPTHTAVLVNNGTVISFGRSTEGQLGFNQLNDSDEGQSKSSSCTNNMLVACGELMTLVGTESQTVEVLGSRELIKLPLSGVLGVDTDTSSCSPPPLTPLTEQMLDKSADLSNIKRKIKKLSQSSSSILCLQDILSNSLVKFDYIDIVIACVKELDKADSEIEKSRKKMNAVAPSEKRNLKHSTQLVFNCPFARRELTPAEIRLKQIECFGSNIVILLESASNVQLRFKSNPGYDHLKRIMEMGRPVSSKVSTTRPPIPSILPPVSSNSPEKMLMTQTGRIKKESISLSDTNIPTWILPELDQALIPWRPDIVGSHEIESNTRLGSSKLLMQSQPSIKLKNHFMSNLSVMQNKGYQPKLDIPGEVPNLYQNIEPNAISTSFEGDGRNKITIVSRSHLLNQLNISNSPKTSTSYTAHPDSGIETRDSQATNAHILPPRRGSQKYFPSQSDDSLDGTMTNRSQNFAEVTSTKDRVSRRKLAILNENRRLKDENANLHLQLQDLTTSLNRRTEEYKLLEQQFVERENILAKDLHEAIQGREDDTIQFDNLNQKNKIEFQEKEGLLNQRILDLQTHLHHEKNLNFQQIDAQYHLNCKIEKYEELLNHFSVDRRLRRDIVKFYAKNNITQTTNLPEPHSKICSIM